MPSACRDVGKDDSGENLQAPAVEAKMLENNIAYIKIPYLGPGKAAETKRQLDALLKRGATNIVLDLRYAAGGDEKASRPLHRSR